MFARKRILRYALLIGLLMSMAEIAVLEGSSNARADALAFVSTPILTAEPDHLYEYQVVPNNYSATLELYWSSAEWRQLLIMNWTLMGVPNSTDIGLTILVLKLTAGPEIAWQNFTIEVIPADNFGASVNLALAFIFGFGLMAVGFKRSEFWIIAGPVWIICALTIFISYGVVFLLVGVGIGMVLFIEGVLGIANK